MKLMTDKLDREACLKRAQLAFSSGYHCAQSALIAMAPACGLEQEEAAKLAASFGGGVGGMGELCGALNGACIALGILKGDFGPGDLEGKEAHYARVREFARRFREQNGSIICRELLQGVETTPGVDPEPRTAEYYARRPCPNLAWQAAHILDEMLSEMEKEKES